MANVTVQARVKPELKAEVEAILSTLGLSTSDAIRVYLHQIVNSRGLPFQPHTASEAVKIVSASSDAAENVEIRQLEEAYQALHPTLKETHLGKYVAIDNNRLIDSDADRVVLRERLIATYPNRFIPIRLVEETPTRTIKTPMSFYRFTPN